MKTVYIIIQCILTAAAVFFTLMLLEKSTTAISHNVSYLWPIVIILWVLVILSAVLKKKIIK